SRWSNGIWVSANSNIKTFTNTGSIQGFNSGVMVRERGTIDNLTNKGTIKSTGTIQPSTTILVSSGIYFYINTIKTLDNEGLISGIMGLNLVAATIDNLTNKGTIESTGGKNNLVAAINLMTSDGDPSYIKTFANEGVIKSNYQGILAEAGNKIDTLINKGTIEAGLNGISFYYYNDEISGNQVNLGNIILESGSSIKAGNNGINIDGTSNKPITVSGSIEVKKDASVSGNNAGIVIGSGKKVNAQIKISGSVTGGAAGIVNEGTIGSSSEDSSTGGIVVSGGSISSSSGGSGIV
ncbi:autotransporter outer membrane beta-barrel domain-containing protein, partial [Campylobacter jejuni]|nr:autotransporter outer membrane beta-barrel domain-containing protein [Campylobacter jejuni]